MPEIVRFGFSGGVFSPKLSMRSDLKKFDLGVAEGTNFFIEYTGGASTRPGTEFIDYIQGDEETARIVEFAFNRNIANTYGILFSTSRIRFIQDGAYVLEATKSITGATSTVLTVVAHGYANTDWVKIDGETYQVAAVTTDTFELRVPRTLAVVNTLAFNGMSVARIYTLVSPYATEDLRNLTFSQYRDELRIYSTDYAERKLVRSGATSWAISTVAFDANNNPPTDVALFPSTAGTAGAVFAVTSVDRTGRESYVATTGMELTRLSVNYTTTAGYMLIAWNAPASGDIAYYKIYRSLVLAGSELHFGMQLGYIGKSYHTRFTDPNIIPDFSQSPPSMTMPIRGGQIFSMTVTAGGSGYTDDARCFITGQGGQDWRGIPIVESGVVTRIRVLNPGTGYVGTPVTVTFGAGSGSGAAASGTPTALSGNDPATSALVQQRRVRAGTNNYPGTLFGSVVGVQDNYYATELNLATDPYALTLDSEQLTPIRFIMSYPEGMFVFQDTGVTQVRGIDDGVIKVGSAKAQELTEEGCARLQPIRVKKDFLYLNAAKTSVYALGPTNLPQYYSPNDISIFSEHYFKQENALVSWTWAKAPHKLLWAARADGSFLSLTYVNEQEVAAWSDHTTRGFVEDVESILENEIDRVYMVVKRVVGGLERRYIERLALRENINPDDMWAVDSGLRTNLIYPAAGIYIDNTNPAVTTVTADTAVFAIGDVGKVFRLGTARGVVTSYVSTTSIVVALDRDFEDDFSDYNNISERLWPQGTWTLNVHVSSISGLSHLEGQTVEILGDGNVLTPQVVTNGSVPLSSDSSYVVAGLGYKGRLRSLPLTASDTAIEGKYKRPTDLAVRLFNSRGLEFGDGKGDQMFPLLKRQGDPATSAPEFLNGLYEVSIAAEMTLDGEILVEKSGPMHATILGYVNGVEIGD